MRGAHGAIGRIGFAFLHWISLPYSAASLRGEHHHRVFEIFQPRIDLDRERELRQDAGQTDSFRPEKLYDDVIPCFQELHAVGYRIGVAGNHHREFVKPLQNINLPLDFLGSSDEWGVEKPSFDRTSISIPRLELVFGWFRLQSVRG
jgi:phosphoglycolate phosphatase-like HAD superfamily hydrolase